MMGKSMKIVADSKLNEAATEQEIILDIIHKMTTAQKASVRIRVFTPANSATKAYFTPRASAR
jgi:hypothetical protein